MAVLIETIENILSQKHRIPTKRYGDVAFTSISSDSRVIEKGALYIAQRGEKVDGHHFIDDAYKKGAVAVVTENADLLKDRAGLVVKDTKAAVGIIASEFYGNPSEKIKIIGVTGTNGKTTTVWLINNLLTALGVKAASIGTLGVWLGEKQISESPLTTPDPISIQKRLAEFLALGVDVCAMEVSSHALSQHRVNGISFDVAVFTNLTRDHLDYHLSMEQYFEAKEKLFNLLLSSGKGVKATIANKDDLYGRILIERYNGIGYAESMIESAFIGKHNRYNLSAAIEVCKKLGFSEEEIKKVTKQLPQVPGRLERFSGEGIDVFVDYAHTPDALERALTTLCELKHNKLWIVFGCGGDRDRGKRPIMGSIASRCADYVVLTSDNPRTEEPMAIINDILSADINPKIVNPDRKEAIVETLKLADKNDIVLIAGKGHEDYQIIGEKTYPFSDREIVKSILCR